MKDSVIAGYSAKDNIRNVPNNKQQHKNITSQHLSLPMMKIENREEMERQRKKEYCE